MSRAMGPLVTIRIRHATAVALMEQLVSELSERCWCAGWMDGTQDAVWELIELHPDESWHWGMCDIEDARTDSALAWTANLIRVLRDATGRWWLDYETPCTVEEYRARSAEQ